MDGAHDMGGAKGFGPVVPEPNEPVFHGDWERRAFALTVAMARPGGWNIDMSRFARENRPPDDYLSKSYFQIWLAGLETLMIERGLVTREEIEAGKVLSPPKPASSRRSKRGRAGDPARRPDRTRGEARRDVRGRRDRADEGYSSGDAYRLPRYVRGRLGTIDSITAVTSSPTPTRSARARTRNGSTPSLRRAGIVGQGCRPDAQRLRRRLGILSGAPNDRVNDRLN